jgi:predicted GNAT family acetyltransferase
MERFIQQRFIIFYVDNKPLQRTMNKFEIDQDGQTAYLEFETDSSGWMTIWHTEVPPALRGRGLATELARAAFEHARTNQLRVDVVCPSALQFLSQHPEYKPLLRTKKP